MKTKESSHSMRVLLTCLLTLACVVTASANKLSVQLHGIAANQIFEDETVTLELSIPSSHSTGTPPDLSMLETDFHIGSRHTSYEMVTINGQFSGTAKLTLSLTPKRSGTLRIPALSWDGNTSEAIEVQVLPLPEAEKQMRSQLAFMEYDIEPESPYVNSAIYIERRFYYQPGVQLASFMPDFPNLENAIEVVIREATSSSVIKDGIRYNLLNDRYVVFPEKSGELIIPSQRIVLSAHIGNSPRRTLVNLNTEIQRLQVQSIPLEYPPAKPWFPASALVANSQFEPSQLDRAMVGEAIRWSVEIVANDAYSESFPKLDLELPTQLKAFTDKPTTTNTICDDKLCGKVVLATTLVPSVVGQWTIPTQRFHWWNTQTNKLDEVVIPSQTIDVIANPALQLTQAQSPLTTADTGILADETPGLTTGLDTFWGGSQSFWQVWATATTLLSVVLVLLIMYLVFAPRLTNGNRTTHNRSTNRQELKFPKFQGRQPIEVKRLILTWLQTHHQLSLVAAIELLESSTEGKLLLTQLNDLIYTKSEGTIDLNINEIEHIVKSLQPYEAPTRPALVPGF